MKRFNFSHPAFLLIIVLLLRLVGQTAAGFSGRHGSFLNIYTFISYCCMVSRAVIWMLVLKKLPLTVAYPFSGTVFLLIIPLSAIVFNEPPDPGRITGALLIFSGIIFTAIGAVKNER